GLGLIMFRYNIYGLANNNPDTSINPQSPYDAGIVNANYFSLSPQAKVDKWTFKTTFVMAWAEQTAQTGKMFWNYNQRRFYNGNGNQGSSLGWEVDLGISFKWDENF